MKTSTQKWHLPNALNYTKLLFYRNDCYRLYDIDMDDWVKCISTT